MSARASLLCLVSMLSGCGFSLPNGVFSCVGPSDCPTGFFCWNSDSRCYDAKEPEVFCRPDTCGDVIADFASLGAEVECGTFPDGCDGVVECPPCADGDTCGANGQNFICGCEDATCESVGAQCGDVPLGCEPEGTVYCGECLGETVCGEDFKCACPEGKDCDGDCVGGCAVDEVCVEGQCCVPSFPCAENECSPPGGLPNGCGDMAICPPCSAGACELQPDSRYACVEDCSCEARGFECGTHTICGATQVCGVCDATVPLCDTSGRCVCRDSYEPNDGPSSAAQVACQGSCGVVAVLFEGEGTLDRSDDIDFYVIDVPHDRDRGLQVEVSGLKSTRELLLTYVCPDGSESIADCSGSSSSVGSDKYCIEDGTNVLRLIQSCSGTGKPATVIAGIGSKDGEFKGACDSYSLTISSFYFEYDD